METQKTNYEVLKKEILSLGEEIGLADHHLKDLKKIRDYFSFRDAYEKTFKAIGEKMGINIFDMDDVQNLKKDKENLEIENNRLKQEIETLNSYAFHKIETLDDEFKVRFINEYWDEFSAWEMEKLFKHGKEFLKNLKG